MECNVILLCNGGDDDQIFSETNLQKLQYIER